MKKLASFLGWAALAFTLALPAFAGSAGKFTQADLSINGGTAATIESADGVAFRLDVAAVGSSYPKIYVIPVVSATRFVTNESLDIVAGGKFLTGITGLKASGNERRTGSDAKADSGTFTSADLGIDFSRTGTYQISVQVWDDEKMLAASNTVTVEACAAIRTVFMTYNASSWPNSYENADPMPATETAPAHYVVNAVVDGASTQIKVAKDLTPTTSAFDLLYNPETGVFRALFDENGYVVKFRTDPRVVEGYGLNEPYGPEGSEKIRLGLNNLHGEEREYAFADDAEIWQRTATYISSIRAYRVESLPITAGAMALIPVNVRWNSTYWMQLNEAGEIAALYLNSPSSWGAPSAPAWYNDLKKFQVGTGPADAETGLAINYYYYQPAAQAGKKYPLVIWFHGSQGGGFSWKPFFFGSDNIAKFATSGYQSQFSAGGAYVMVPRSNEDFGASHNRRLRWDDAYNGKDRAQTTPFFLALEEFLASHPDVDADRIYVGGFSAGGGMTWLALREHPELFAAAFPAAAPERTLPEADSEELEALSFLPVWTVHADKDPVVPLTQKIRDVMTGLAARNSQSRMTVMKSTAHSELTYVQNNMINPTSGQLYVDADGKPVPGTLIDWLNAQTAFAGAETK